MTLLRASTTVSQAFEKAQKRQKHVLGQNSLFAFFLPFLGAILGPSWGLLGAILGLLGAILGGLDNQLLFS